MSSSLNPTVFSHVFGDGKVRKSRSRRGCLTCRSRRLKCDEVHPKCANCRLFDRSCAWGLRASFHSSRMWCLSEKESASLSGPQTKSHKPMSLKFVDNTEEIESYYQESCPSTDEYDGNNGDSNSRHTIYYEDLDPPLRQTARYSSMDSQNNMHYAEDPPTCQAPTLPEIQVLADHHYPREQLPRIRSLSFLGLSHDSFEQSAPTFSPSTIATPPSINKDKMPSWPIDDRKKAMLIISYLRETATWCETTDSMRQFSLQTTQDLLESQAYSAAAVAVASRQRDNTTGVASLETLELYDFARETICSLESWQNDHMVLAGALQLCVYCMMSMEVNEWRLHLRGCAGTFQEMGWNGSSKGLPAACFWAFARIDIWAAYLTKQPTLIPTDFWISPSYDADESTPLQDRYSNKAIWIFGRIINELSKFGHDRCTSVSAQRPSTDIFSDLWIELDSWKENCPKAVQSLIEIPASGEDAFPLIIFGNTSAICGNIFYHAGSILLLERDLTRIRMNNNSKYQLSWHAQRIGGISTATEDHANLVNNLQPLFLAARYYHEASKKIAVLRHLTQIERSTGWKTGSRSAELRELWGFG